MKKIIYADNAATTALRPIALAAMKPYLINEFGSCSGEVGRAETGLI